MHRRSYRKLLVFNAEAQAVGAGVLGPLPRVNMAFLEARASAIEVAIPRTYLVCGRPSQASAAVG
jgi:hypothetical protein